MKGFSCMLSSAPYGGKPKAGADEPGLIRDEGFSLHFSADQKKKRDNPIRPIWLLIPSFGFRMSALETWRYRQPRLGATVFVSKR